MHVLINKTVEKFALQIQNKNGKASLHLLAENNFVEVDALHMSNVISNLIDNALKYAELPSIEMRTRNEGNNFVFEIKDNGIGMSREDQVKVFDKFYRVTGGNIHNVKGFGLGLSYVKAITEAFGGSIAVNSKPGRGSTFIVKLPQTS